MTEIRVLVVEDEPLVAEDIRDCLHNIDFVVSGVAYDSDSALRELNENTPDMVLLDIDLDSELDGIDIGHHINQFYQIPFVFLTAFADRATLERVKETRPMGYVVKPFDEKDLFTSLELAYFNYSQQHHNHDISQPLVNKKLPTPLTTREFEILRLILDGKTNKQIANELFVSTNTIKTHISNLYVKLEVNSRTNAIAKVREMMLAS